jgi:hypothetical protein
MMSTKIALLSLLFYSFEKKERREVKGVQQAHIQEHEATHARATMNILYNLRLIMQSIREDVMGGRERFGLEMRPSNAQSGVLPGPLPLKSASLCPLLPFLPASSLFNHHLPPRPTDHHDRRHILPSFVPYLLPTYNFRNAPVFLLIN